MKKKKEIAVADPSGLTALQDATCKVLADYDKKMKEFDPNAASMEEAWRAACSFKDTNEIINHNIREMQLLIQSEHTSHLKSTLGHEEHLAELRNTLFQTKKEAFPGGDEEYFKFVLASKAEIRKVMQEYKDMEQKDILLISKLAGSVRNLVQEYRTCLTSKRFYFHVSQLKQLIILFKAVLFDEIHDANVLTRISQRLDDGYRKIFFVQINEDGKDGGV
jgi:hypothetical protein